MPVAWDLHCGHGTTVKAPRTGHITRRAIHPGVIQVRSGRLVTKDATAGCSAGRHLTEASPPFGRSLSSEDALHARRAPYRCGDMAAARDEAASAHGPGRARVPRPHLHALLDQASARSLTLVSAPTGYGKTTLVSGWARAADGTVAWLTLEPADSDPVRFVQYIVAALAYAGVTIGASTQRSAAAPGVDLAGAVIPRLLNDLAARSAPVVAGPR